MDLGSNNAQIVPTFEEFIKTAIGEQLSSDLDKIALSGSVASATYPYNKCDGLISKITGSTVTVTAIATSAISKTTIVAELDRILDAALPQVRESADFQIFLSSKMMMAYRQYVGTIAADKYGPYGSKINDYLGYKLIESQNLAANVAVAIAKGNALLLTDLISDFDDIHVKNMFESSLVRETRISVHYKFGIACPKPYETVFYRP